MNQEVQPEQYQSFEVEAMWFQNLLLGLLAAGMVVYFFKIGPANFFKEFWED